MKEIVVQHDVTRMRGYSSAAKKKKQRTHVMRKEMSRLKISSTNQYDEPEDDEDDEDEGPPLLMRREESHGTNRSCMQRTILKPWTIRLWVDRMTRRLLATLYLATCRNMTSGQTGYAPTDYLETRS